MMSLDVLSVTLDRAGAYLSAEAPPDGPRLVVDVPEGVLTPEVVAALQRHKAALLDRVARPGPGPEVPRPKSRGERAATLPGRPDPAHAAALADLLSHDPRRTARGTLVYSDPDDPPFVLFDGPSITPADLRRSLGGNGASAPRPAGAPSYGRTRAGSVVELAARTPADEQADPVRLVTGPGWPAWYPWPMD
jgi:hypothetical protein